MTLVAVSPDLLRWARDRSGVPADKLGRRFPKLSEWEQGAAQPTLKQLETFARATNTPFGHFFLSEPPEVKLPIPDFRTPRDHRPRQPSANLLETIYTMQRRQEWLREFLSEEGVEPLAFIDSVNRFLHSKYRSFAL